MTSEFAAQLKDRIERQYTVGGYSLGWRLLYSPAAVLDGARVAFVGLNPGGRSRPNDHAEFAMSQGSAYELESWDAPPGKSKLQRQVLSLFEKIGERPESVLAGNLVPFRSPSWNEFPDRRRALAFGKDIWQDILARACPTLVICMGNDVFAALSHILRVGETENVSVGWGNITGERGEFTTGKLVRLPHLSRFGVVTRAESQPGLMDLLSATGTRSVVTNTKSSVAPTNVASQSQAVSRAPNAEPAVARSGATYPGWVFKPIPANAKGLIVTTGPSNSPLPHPKRAVHIAAGNGRTMCGLDTQVAPQGHKTYGLQYVVLETLPPPRGGRPFKLCSNC